MQKIYLLIFSFLYLNSFAQENQKLSLEQAYEFALQNNINIKNAKFDVKNAEFKRKEVTAMGLPQINAKVDYNNFIKQPVSLLPAEIMGGPKGEYAEVVFGTKQNLTAGATLSQLIFNGSYLVGLQSAKVYKQISELALEKNEKAIKEAVFLTYSTGIVIDENLKIIDKNLEVLNKNYHDINEIFKVGLGEEQAVDQMEYSLTSLKSTKNNLLRTKTNMLDALKFLIGKNSDEQIELSTNLDELMKINETKLIDESKFNSWDNNIDVRIATNLKKSHELSLKFEKSKYLPNLVGFLSSSYNAYSNQFDFSSQKYFNTTVAGLSLNIPIFSGFERKNKTAQAKIELERAEMQLQNTKEKLTKTAKEQFNSYQNALEQLETSKKLQELSTKIYRTQQTKYYEGIGTSFELTQAETQKYSADNSYIQAVFEVIQSKIKLDNTLNQL